VQFSVATDANVCPECGDITFTLANGNQVVIKMSDESDRVFLAHQPIVQSMLSDHEDTPVHGLQA